MTSNVHALETIKRPEATSDRPGQAEVEVAFRTIIQWTGDDPDRNGLIETPERMARAFQEFFVGHSQNPTEILQKTFEEIEGYDEMIALRGIRFESHCEHHWLQSLAKPLWPTFQVAEWLVLASLPALPRHMRSAFRFKKR